MSASKFLESRGFFLFSGNWTVLYLSAGIFPKFQPSLVIAMIWTTKEEGKGKRANWHRTNVVAGFQEKSFLMEFDLDLFRV